MACAAAAFSCGGVQTPSPAPSALATTLLRIEGPMQFAIGGGCHATGIETCFNAVDEDCNGLVDEGCGVANGPMQIVAAWDVPDVDVDLRVVDPNGEEAKVAFATALGLVKDRDCPGVADACGGQNTEAVASLGEAVVRGRYRASIELKRAWPAELREVHVRLGGHVARDAVYGRAVLTKDLPAASVEWMR